MLPALGAPKAVPVLKGLAGVLAPNVVPAPKPPVRGAVELPNRPPEGVPNADGAGAGVPKLTPPGFGANGLAGVAPAAPPNSPVPNPPELAAGAPNGDGVAAELNAPPPPKAAVGAGLLPNSPVQSGFTCSKFGQICIK